MPSDLNSLIFAIAIVIFGAGFQYLMPEHRAFGVVLVLVGLAGMLYAVRSFFLPGFIRGYRKARGSYSCSTFVGVVFGVGVLVFGGVWGLMRVLDPKLSNGMGAQLREMRDTSYRDLVAEVIRSLDPGAHVAVSNAIDSPDGFRKVDVEVRSGDGRLIAVDVVNRADGHKVGVELVDQADSKRKDIKADTVILCSNTGFDELAIRKAKRMRIGLITVLKQGDQRAKAIIQEEIYLRNINLNITSISWDGATDADNKLLREYAKNVRDVTFNSESVASWLEDKATLVVMANPTIQAPLVDTFHLKKPTQFSAQGRPVMLRSLTIKFHPNTQWLSQVVELDAKSAIYNYVRGLFMFSPGLNTFTLKDVGFDAATPMGSPPSIADLGFGLLPGEVKIEAQLTRVTGLDKPKGTEIIPNLDHLIEPGDLSLKVTDMPPEKTRDKLLTR